MKRKWMNVILWILVLCLAGCRSAGTGTSDPRGSSEPMPSTEEWGAGTTEDPMTRITALMYDYLEIVGKLDQYRFDGVVSISTGDRSQSFQGNDALTYAYNKLMKLEEIDPWLNETCWAEHVYPGYYPNFDRQGYLEKFSIVEDILLRVECTRYNEDGENITKWDNWLVYNYNPDGTLCFIKNGVENMEEYHTYNHYTGADLFYCYDQSGRWIKGYFGAPNNKGTTLTRSFDEAGRVTVECFVKRDTVINRIEYTYDDAGALIRKVMYENVSHDPYLSLRYVTDYFYDEAGQLIREEERYVNYDNQGNPAFINSCRTVEYSYDSDGRLAASQMKYNLYTVLDQEACETELFHTIVSNSTYAYDENGRLLARTTVHLPAQYPDGTSAAVDVQIVEERYIYGDCYIYGQIVVEP